ncbi:MAG: D-amino acid aminotransferase [Erysipelotrichia bacterium]|nr:D-amino acid aminotransferase [Erysipelotrichia bacterium]
MKEIGYYNGSMGTLNEIQAPISDRAMYFGDGVYDVAFAFDNRIFALDDHLDRFYHSMEMMDMHFHLSRGELTAEIEKCMHAADSDQGLLLYFQASRGVAKRGHAYPKGVNPSLMIMVTAVNPIDYHTPMKLITVEDTRFFHCNIKTLNLIPNCMAAQKTAEAGCDEAVLHRGEQLTECAHSSLLILKEGRLIAPILNELVLPSISRKHLFELAAQLGIPTEARDISMQEVRNADEVLVCSTTKLCARADIMDGNLIGMKDEVLFHTLQDAYFHKVQDECGCWPDGNL